MVAEAGPEQRPLRRTQTSGLPSQVVEEYDMRITRIVDVTADVIADHVDIGQVHDVNGSGIVQQQFLRLHSTFLQRRRDQLPLIVDALLTRSSNSALL